MSSHRKPAKARHSKLRASCDTCYLAKIKCSKARPVCSRCLTCGTECKYSPSSRAGRSGPDSGQGSQQYISEDTSLQEDLNSSTIAYSTPSMSTEPEYSSYRPDTDWPPTPSPSEVRMNRNPISLASMSRRGGNEGFAETTNSGTNTELFDPIFSWANTPRTVMTSDSTLITSIAPWYEGESSSNSSSTGGGGGGGPGPGTSTYMSNSLAKTPTCNCFTTCLKALEGLHKNTLSTTSVPSFDVVLTVNRKAVDGCAMMLNCPICLSQPRSGPTTTMLLGAIIGKIMDIYQDASKNYFGLTPADQTLSQMQQPQPQPQALPLTIGTHRVAGDGGRWLEMEIIMYELRKLKVLFAKFQESARATGWEGGEGGADAGMHGAVTNYLYQSLHLTFEVLKIRKNNHSYG